MSPSESMQPAVEPPLCVLGPAIDETGSLPVALQSTVQADLTSTSSVVDVGAKQVPSSQSQLPLNESSNPPGVVSPINDGEASSVELVATCSLDNVDGDPFARCISHLYTVDGGIVVSSIQAHKEICTVSLAGLTPAEIRVKRQAVVAATQRTQHIAELIVEILADLVVPGCACVELPFAPGESDTLASLIAQDGAQLPKIIQSIRKGTPTSRRFVLEILRFMTMKCLLMAMRVHWYDVHLPMVEENEKA
ncbi:hypothetical protein GSI_08846 [Ganoderma sinense ZZ0214-1]|uniref:Uncharacterized protein n=1 Tax=Ganoderma sinense ZZ0214-1 TaxID=1077348 RepID=A0A2G8S4V6_9APHY|nr:hypothetical protein GSI_08846 [Ganoderma sinense ZZ0214-1]